MIKNKQNKGYYFLAMLLILTGMTGGGYFCFVSAAAAMVLMAVITYHRPETRVQGLKAPKTLCYLFEDMSSN